MTKARETKTTNIDLDVPGRLSLFGSLPRRGRYSELTAIAGLQQLLQLSDEERKSAGLIEQEDGSVMFNPQANFAAHFKLNSAEIGIVKKVLKDLEQSEALPLELMELYETVVLNGS